MPSQEEFLETWPLYTVGDYQGQGAPDSISLMCSRCGKETTWRRVKVNDLAQPASLWGYIAVYRCGLCKEEYPPVVSFFVRYVQFSKEQPNVPVKAQKIGQFPAQSIDIDRDLEKRLGDSARLYKNALVCRSHNFGIAALAYMRRIIEEKTNELIEVVAEQAGSYKAEAEIISAIRAAKNDKLPYERRLQIAAEAIPANMKEDGANPLGALYDLLSAGLHAKSEEECIAIMDETRDIFEYVFAKLRAEIEDRNRMMSKVKKLFSSRAAKPKDGDTGQPASSGSD